MLFFYRPLQVFWLTWKAYETNWVLSIWTKSIVLSPLTNTPRKELVFSVRYIFKNNGQHLLTCRNKIISYTILSKKQFLFSYLMLNEVANLIGYFVALLQLFCCRRGKPILYISLCNSARPCDHIIE